MKLLVFFQRILTLPIAAHRNKTVQIDEFQHWSDHMKRDIGMDYPAPLERCHFQRSSW